MNILLVNDDGYNEIGLLKVKNVLKKYGNVFVSAPLNQKSGASASISIHNGIRISMEDENMIIVDGTPVDCVYAGLTFFKDKEINLVVSGANNGYNLSFDTLFSGTVGAGMAASLFKIKVICFSSDWYNFDSIEEYTEESLKFIFKNKLLDKASILSVNFPSREFEHAKGIKFARIYNIDSQDELYMDNGVYRMKRKERAISPSDSDVEAVKSGYISITPLKASLQDDDLIEELIKK